jgi:uncharacterized protein (DUF1501 family)
VPRILVNLSNQPLETLVTQHLLEIDRRSFMKLGGASLFGLLHGRFQDTVAAVATGEKRVVVLELNGGNDGLNTLVPFGDDLYYQARPKLAIKESSALRLKNVVGFGLHPELRKLRERYDQQQVAVIRGVGHPSPDLSHFAMQDYWRSGHPAGMAHTGQTGWLGRTLDRIANGSSEIAGLTVGWSLGPMMYAQTATTASAGGAWSAHLNAPWQVQDVYLDAIAAMSATFAGSSKSASASRKGLENGLALDQFLRPFQAKIPARLDYPDTHTGQLLGFAADILAVPSAIRALHVALPLDFDHHAAQLDRHARNLAELDAAVDVFLRDLEGIGIADTTLVMTTSEFGRRVTENAAGGTDHGTASCMFLIGPAVKGGLYGQQPPLDQLDANGNLVATIAYTDVLATVAQNWLGATGVFSAPTLLDVFV